MAKNFGHDVDYGTGVCAVCGKEFVKKSSGHKCCSQVCQLIHRRERARKWRADRAGEGVTYYTRVCPICGLTFRTPKTNKAYCSDECREAQGSKEQYRRHLEATDPERAAMIREVRAEEARRAKAKADAEAHAKFLMEEAARRAREEAEAALREESRGIKARSFTAGYNSVQMAKIAAENRMTYGKLQGLITCNGGELPDYIRVPDMNFVRLETAENNISEWGGDSEC